MAYQNKRDYDGSCSKMGFTAEEDFKKLLIADGYSIKEPTLQENMNNIDVIASKNGQSIKIDIKAMKRVSRTGENSTPQDKLIWIELISNSEYNKIGWAMNPLLDYVSFEFAEKYCMVKRQDLADFVAKTVDLRKIALKSEDALYKKYQRKGKSDCLTMILGSDVEKLARKIYPKSPLTLANN